MTIAGLNIAPCVRFTRKQEQKRRSQVSGPSLPVRNLRPRESQGTGFLADRSTLTTVLFAGADHRQLQAAEEKAACPASER